MIQYCGEAPWPRGSLPRARFETCVWRAVPSHTSHHHQDVLLAQFSLDVHKGCLKPHLFHFISGVWLSRTRTAARSSLLSGMVWCDVTLFNLMANLSGLAVSPWAASWCHPVREVLTLTASRTEQSTTVYHHIQSLHITANHSVNRWTPHFPSRGHLWGKSIICHRKASPEGCIIFKHKAEWRWYTPINRHPRKQQTNKSLALTPARTGPVTCDVLCDPLPCCEGTGINRSYPSVLCMGMHGATPPLLCMFQYQPVLAPVFFIIPRCNVHGAPPSPVVYVSVSTSARTVLLHHSCVMCMGRSPPLLCMYQYQSVLAPVFCIPSSVVYVPVLTRSSASSCDVPEYAAITNSLLF